MKTRVVVLLMLVALVASTAASFGQQVPLNPTTIPKYVDPLVIPPAMPPAPVDPDTGQFDPDYYEIGVYHFMQQVLPLNVPVGMLPYPQTTVWGYGYKPSPTSDPVANYPAFTIEAWRGTPPVRVKWTNELWGVQHPLAVDQMVHWADPLDTGHTMDPYFGPVPLVTHVHGAEVQSDSDGYPEDWFTPGFAITGLSRMGMTHREVFEYPNQQRAATLWYHDHVLGITRLNVYMGLAGFYLLRDPDDPYDYHTPTVPGIPKLPGPAPQLNDSGGPYYEIPIVIQDRMFDTAGQLYFPSLGINPMDYPFWIPEFVGDVIVVNGKTWPYLDVQPRKYRFRLLNGSNARFYSLSLANQLTGAPGPAFIQIGTDGGYLAAPVVLNDPTNPSSPRLVFAPGERADVVIDFSAYASQNLLLKNTAKAPFPRGVAANGRTVGQIMLFRVGPGPVTDNSAVPASLTTIPTLVQDGPKRALTLNEVMAMGGPLEILLNNTKWMANITEIPSEGSTEVWEIINLTADTHPIHLHLTQFQLLNRHKFNLKKYWAAYDGAFGALGYLPAVGPPYAYGTWPQNPVLGGNPDVTPFLQGKPMPPDPNEMGWKDTFRMNPREVTRVLVRFAPQDTPVSTIAQFPFDPSTGPGYVWHCHILDHEDNEMMRPYLVEALPRAP